MLVQSLAYLTRTKSLYGGDLEAAVTTMRTVASRIQYRLQQSARNSGAGSFHNKESHIRQILQNVLRLEANGWTSQSESFSGVTFDFYDIL